MNGSLRNPSGKFGGSRNRKPLAFNGGFPTKALLLAKSPPTLIENKLSGSYKSVAEYVDVHFDLLLEDFMCPLREALHKFNRNQKSSLNGARVYYNVTLKHVQFRPREVTCQMEVDKSKGSCDPSFGGLLVLTNQGRFNGDIFLATVTSDTSKDDVKAVELRLKFPRDCKQDLDTLCERKFTVIEGKAFFYVYFHVLKSLNNLDENNFPMKKYIVYSDSVTCASPPAYLNRLTMYKVLGHRFEVLSNDQWPPPKDLGIDNESQYSALRKALTEDIALIQGPPGTGKTYFGVLLVRVLLDNESVWNPKASTPLVVICQSNEALDHFLEKLLPYGKVVRVGEQCQSPKLKAQSLKELVCRRVSEVSRIKVQGLSTHLTGLDKLRQLKKDLSKGIVSVETFVKFGIISEELSLLFTCDEIYLKWLGMHVKAERKLVTEADSDFIVSIQELSQHIYQLEVCGEYLLALHLKQDLEMVSKMIAGYEGNSRQDQDIPVVCKVDSLLQLPPADAQNLYLTWMDELHKCLTEKVQIAETELSAFWELLPPSERHDAILQVVKSASVVGMTSTGAASRQLILQEMKSPIVIFEEAGELLESHVVVSMTQHCQHLIMMGDHKQLKPGVTTHHLARDLKLNVSLFERLQTSGVVRGTCLTTQYRMRPEISALLKPHIYTLLEDGPGTTGRPAVRGLAKSVFFLDHRNCEEKSADKTGCWNPYEVEMVINLAKYLVSMGYATTQITIITMYSEQKNKLIEARDRTPALSDLQIASVDSFQGKENEVILLSLVRSNKTGNIGFLKEVNRVCVALSRARLGMYIVGNMECLKRGGKMWRDVSRRLQEQGSLGSKLRLVCATHGATRYGATHDISEIKDWEGENLFCRPCQLDAKMSAAAGASHSLSTKVPVPLSLSKAVPAPVVPSPNLPAIRIRRCSCCRSFYCDKAKEALRIDLELSSALDKLTLC